MLSKEFLNKPRKNHNEEEIKSEKKSSVERPQNALFMKEKYYNNGALFEPLNSIRKFVSLS